LISRYRHPGIDPGRRSARRLAPESRLGSENELPAYSGVARPALRLLERHGIFVGRADPAAAFLAFREHAQSLVLPRRRIAEMRDALLERLVLGLVARGGGRTAWLICY
jgi:hypothetical protein